jgi:hypothetical protein
MAAGLHEENLCTATNGVRIIDYHHAFSREALTVFHRDSLQISVMRERSLYVTGLPSFIWDDYDQAVGEGYSLFIPETIADSCYNTAGVSAVRVLCAAQ